MQESIDQRDHLKNSNQKAIQEIYLATKEIIDRY